METNFDVIIIGGSYAGLAAGMALGRALKKILIIDGGKPCNLQTPYSHNFLTHDGKRPAEIASLGRQQVQRYKTITFFEGTAISGIKDGQNFKIYLASGETFQAKKLIFATGIKDLMPDIDGFPTCWGITVLHCPYCHGYEVRNEETGMLGNGEGAYDLGRLISNWTGNLTLFTNGPSTLTTPQAEQFSKHQIQIIEKQVRKLEHINGNLQYIVFKDGSRISRKVLYAPVAFQQHCQIPESLGCELTEEGYIKTDGFLQTTVPGIFACGDNATRLRTVANAVAMGTTAGMSASKKVILEEF
jgi:thioredoxin reductase